MVKCVILLVGFITGTSTSIHTPKKEEKAIFKLLKLEENIGLCTKPKNLATNRKKHKYAHPHKTGKDNLYSFKKREKHTAKDGERQ
jgi:hypothetical protein